MSISQRKVQDSGDRLERKPRLLIFSWWFPPQASIACVRLANMASRLAELGWEVRVVTPEARLWKRGDPQGALASQVDEAGVMVRGTPHALPRLVAGELRVTNTRRWSMEGVLTALVWRLKCDLTEGWFWSARQRWRSAAKPAPDLILASGPPFTAFRLAEFTARRVGSAKK